MARPGPIVLAEVDTEYCRMQVTKSIEMFQITYNDIPVGIRKLVDGLGMEIKKYPRTNYDNEGSARAAARRLNHIFNTDAFGYRRLF